MAVTAHYDVSTAPNKKFLVKIKEMRHNTLAKGYTANYDVRVATTRGRQLIQGIQKRAFDEMRIPTFSF